MEIGYPDKLFNLTEANALLPLVRKVTDKHRLELSPIQARLNKMLSNDPRRNSFEQDYEDVVSRWRNKIERLGAHVAGLWVVEFNVGEGALSWKHPELKLGHFRLNDTATTDRLKLGAYIEEHDPDWVR